MLRPSDNLQIFVLLSIYMQESHGRKWGNKPSKPERSIDIQLSNKRWSNWGQKKLEQKANSFVTYCVIFSCLTHTSWYFANNLLFIIPFLKPFFFSICCLQRDRRPWVLDYVFFRYLITFRFVSITQTRFLMSNNLPTIN